MATDGLWDVSENEAVARTVFQTLHKYPTEKHRYTMVAQELVAKARGKINDYGHWRLADSKAAATVDDISVIVIPVYQYYKEHVEYEQKCLREYRERLERETTAQALEAKEEEEQQQKEQINSLVNGMQEMAHVVVEPEMEETKEQEVKKEAEGEEEQKESASEKVVEEEKKENETNEVADGKVENLDADDLDKTLEKLEAVVKEPKETEKEEGITFFKM